MSSVGDEKVSGGQQNTLHPAWDTESNSEHLDIDDAVIEQRLDQNQRTRIRGDAPPLATAEDQQLMAVVEIGDELEVMLGVVRVQMPDGRHRQALVHIQQSFPQYDLDHAIRMPRFLGWLETGQRVVMGSANFPNWRLPEAEQVVFAADGSDVLVENPARAAARILTPDAQPHDENPFDYMPWSVPDRYINPPKTEAIPHQRRPEAEPSWSREFEVEGNRFRILGRDKAGYLVMCSVDQTGQARTFFVYQSRSEGSWRVSQGRAEHSDYPVLMKGGGGSEAQYTQDTQLHPAVLAGIVSNLDTRQDELDVPASDMLEGIYSGSQARALETDFNKHRRTLPLAAGPLDAQLHRMRAGYLSEEDLAELAGQTDPNLVAAGLNHELENLNQALEVADVMPDFTRPQGSITAEHPILGVYVIERYTKVMNGRAVEWFMARDPHGRIWIDRIRFADSHCTPYGTDAEIPYSGILTSKPLEYTQQSDGLPLSLRPPTSSRGYNDITPFLNLLLPVQRYRATLGVVDRGRNYYGDGQWF